MRVYRNAIIESDEIILPGCKTDFGCVVGDVAPDPDAQEFVDNFIRAYALESDYARSKVLEAKGLLDDVDLYLECESVVRSHVISINKKKHKAKK